MAPLVTPDFTEVAILGAGTYKARVTDVESKHSQKGDMYLRWKMEVFGNDNAKLNGKTFFHNTMITGAGAGALKTLLVATIGAIEGEFNTDGLMGKEVKVVLGPQRNNPEYLEVKSLTSIGS